MKKIFILIALSFVYMTILTKAQQLNYTANYPNYSIDLRKEGSNSPTSWGGLYTYIGSNTAIYEIGKLASAPTYGHGVYQWNISDLEIPNGSTIHSVTVSFNYSLTTVENTTINYFNCSDITTSNLDLNTLWNSTDNTQAIPIGEGNYSTQDKKLFVRTTFNNGSNFVNQFTNSIDQNNRFTLGIAWKYEGPTADVAYWNFSVGGLYPSISVSYTPPQQTVTLDQRLSNNLQVGKLRKWEGTQFTPYPYINPGTQYVFSINSTQTIQGDQTVYPNGNSNEKYNNWNGDEGDVKNHHSFTIYPQTDVLTSNLKITRPNITIKNSLEGTTLDGGQIRIKDPWLVDYPDASYGGVLRNQGMSAPFREQTSPFAPNLSSSYNGYVYKGIFLNQSGPGINWLGTYYSVGSLSEQDITVNNQSRKFYPFKWDGTGVSVQSEYYPETGIVFNTPNAVATAILKGQLMSNSTTGISSNSQRKMVRTDNGIYHVVYESMGHIFYTHSLSSNFTGGWSADQLVLYNAKNPAIEYHGNIIKIVCEYYDPAYSTNVDLFLLTYMQQTNGLYENSDAEIVATCPSAYFGSAKPVLAYNNGQIVVVYRKNATEGLKERTKWYYSNPGNWVWSSENTIPETDVNSINPAIAETNYYLHIVFESLSTIQYKFAYIQSTSWQYNPVINLSTGCGFSVNSNPSISISASPLKVMVSWTGYYTSKLDKRLSKENEYLFRFAAVSKVGYGTVWGGSSNFSENVLFTNNNSLNSSEGSILSWSERNGLLTKYVRRNQNGTYTPIANLSSNGIQTLISNGAGFSDIKSLVFNISTSAPYLLNKCTNEFSQSANEKTGGPETIDIRYGRAGVVEKNGVEFLFNIGDVMLDGQSIKITERIDTLPVVNLEELNSVVRTESFSLNSQSELIFSDYYYVVNKSRANSVLSDQFNVSFKCDLVNEASNQVVGTFDNITYSKLNVQKYANPSYIIDCSGIQTGNYFLRLFTTVNEDVNLYLSDIQRDDIVLSKEKLLVRNFKGEGIPLSYDLEPNYPNPFNPTTTIRYQLPQDGLVTLKVYDILGAEVATLVNETKLAGKYEVNFNASQLSSGVYIYKIQSGNFVSSKKMILLR